MVPLCRVRPFDGFGSVDASGSQVLLGGADESKDRAAAFGLDNVERGAFRLGRRGQVGHDSGRDDSRGEGPPVGVAQWHGGRERLQHRVWFGGRPGFRTEFHAGNQVGVRRLGPQQSHRHLAAPAHRQPQIEDGRADADQSLPSVGVDELD